ncbi:hypothetical protein [Caballeronia sp. LZ034LL]|uniref:hypothetical protein n=1 Tax=Caballeronia sp. LZ034LL TaxID=3038567 RepID=UPI002866E9AA|nr:hypothetical protein [Caballeronia sp. LZ034LL]MDR5838117.1 hypothetical protein [Caballeronia sp. LZ034LL]
MNGLFLNVPCAFSGSAGGRFDAGDAPRGQMQLSCQIMRSKPGRASGKHAGAIFQDDVSEPGRIESCKLYFDPASAAEN